MTTAIANPPSEALNAFYEQLRAKVRENVTQLIPEEVLQEMSKRAVEEVFFKTRFEEVGDKYNSRKVERPSLFSEMVREVAMPFMTRMAAERAKEMEPQLAELVKTILDPQTISIMLTMQMAKQVGELADSWQMAKYKLEQKLGVGCLS